MEKHFIRAYESGDELQITNLLTSALDDWSLRGVNAIDFWRWLYLDNPNGTNIILLGIDGQRIIACNHQLFLKIKIGDEIVDSIYSTDSVVHHDYRRRGIYNQLIKKTLEIQENRQIIFDYFFTENQIVKESMEKRYPNLPYEMKKLVRIKDIDIHMTKKPTSAAWIKKIGLKIIITINKYRLKTKVRKPPKNLHIEKIKNFNKKYESFWEKNSRYYNFILEKNREYMNWRYTDKRAGDYIVYTSSQDDEIQGVLIGKIVEKEDYLEGNIVDLLTLHNDTTNAYHLIRNFITSMDNRAINCIYTLVQKGHPFEKTFKELGFINTQTRIPIFYNQVGADKISKISTEPSEKYMIQLGDFFIV